MSSNIAVNTTCKVLLVYPRFSGGSFWNFRAACEIVGAKYPAPPLGLITVAAMLPAHWDVKLIDCNTKELTDADMLWADLVMTGGMINQQWDALRIIETSRKLGVKVVVGGPDATSSPHIYESADFRVLGEAEGVIADFIAAWTAGAQNGTFTAEKFTADVTTTPIPRFDLLKFKDYTQMAVQFSRGCPFVCEFCDIIELYGRRPRAKTNPQMLAELQRIYESGYRGSVDFVDDNLIGNKKAVKLFLVELLNWQKERGYPFSFSTEASLNIADDAELLSLLSKCGFYCVFIGIESPDPDVLNATRKKQNTRRDIVASIRKVYDAGLIVTAGFIVGFDGEHDHVSAEIIKLIEDAAIPVAMAGLLYALPNTQLTRRLAVEGRLHPDHDMNVDATDDQCVHGLNFDTQRPRIEVLMDYRRIVASIYDPIVYQARVMRMVKQLKLQETPLFTRSLPGEIMQAAQMAWNVTRHWPKQRGLFWQTVLACVLLGPSTIRPALQMIALYLHLGPYTTHVVEEIDKQIASLKAEEHLTMQHAAQAMPIAAHAM